MKGITEVKTFGDARTLILQTIISIRDGELSVNQGMAIAANMKVMNDNIQAEINYTKTCLLANEKGMDFGSVMRMGTKLIGSVSDEVKVIE